MSKHHPFCDCEICTTELRAGQAVGGLLQPLLINTTELSISLTSILKDKYQVEKIFKKYNIKSNEHLDKILSKIRVGQ